MCRSLSINHPKKALPILVQVPADNAAACSGFACIILARKPGCLPPSTVEPIAHIHGGVDAARLRGPLGQAWSWSRASCPMSCMAGTDSLDGWLRAAACLQPLSWTPRWQALSRTATTSHTSRAMSLASRTALRPVLAPAQGNKAYQVWLESRRIVSPSCYGITSNACAKEGG